MAEVPRAGGTSNDGRAAPEARLFATFKMATAYVEIVQKRNGTGMAKAPANVNRFGLIDSDRS